MQVTYRQLVTELIPAFKRLSQLQQQGGVALHDKVSYALNKNYHELQVIMKSYFIKEHELLKEHVESESKGAAIRFKIVGQGQQQDFDYKKTVVDGKETPDFHRNAVTEAMETLKDTEVTYDHKIKVSEEEIAKVHNFPMEIYSVFSDFEIITSLPIPKLVSMNGK